MSSLLIGSRAWNDNYETTMLGPDWDFVMSKQELINLLNGGFIMDVSYASLQDGKVRVTADPRVLEIELEEAYQSNKLLHNFEVTSSKFNIGFPFSPISPMACLALKTSHITFPVNWRKNAIQLAAMREWFKTDSLTELFGSNVQHEQFKQLVTVRSKETLARILANTKSRAVDNSDLKVRKSKLLDEQSFAKFAPIDQSDAMYFSTTDTSVSRSKFNSGTTEFKFEVVQKQLELIAGLYFIDHAALAKLSLEERCTEIYLLALQTFCCQQVAEVVTNHHALAQRTYRIYSMYRTRPTKKEPEVQDLVRKLSAMNVTELPLPSDQQVAESTLGNPVIQWLVDHWSAVTVVPSPAFKEIVVKYSQETQVQENPVLPPELADLIFGLIDEHVTYSRITALNKHYRAIYNSNEAWKKFANKIWTEDQLSFSKLGINNEPSKSKKEMRKNEKIEQVHWLQVFQEIYNRALQHSFILCRHCKDFHDSIAYGREERDESYWAFCPCDECDAGSWHACEYFNDYDWQD